MAGKENYSIHNLGNLNPAVSVGLLAGGKLSLLKCVVYVIAQCIGAVIGAGILHLVTPSQHRAVQGGNGSAVAL